MDFKTTINGIFSPRKNHFAVPNYQRAYSWEKDKHVLQFLKDLEDHPKSVAQYHLGHFLFEKDNNDKNKYWIIDGQQRMTTVVIFLACIQKKLSTLPEQSKGADNLYTEYLFNSDDQQKFATVEYDNNFFINTVIEGREDKIDTRSRRRIKEAFDFFQEKINTASIEQILHYKELIEEAKITTDIVEDKAEATQIFTFQNDRGKDLTNLEKLKAFLMLQIFLACKDTERDPNPYINFVEREFEAIYKALEKIEIANEDQVFNYHALAFLPSAPTALDRVKNAVEGLNADEQRKWIKDFAVALKRSFEIVITIQEKRNTYSHIADVLYLDQANSFPLLLKLHHYHENDIRIEKPIRLMEIILFRLSYTTGNFQTNSLHTVASRYKGDLEQLNETLLYHSRSGFQPYWNFEGSFHQYLDGDHHYISLTRYLLWKYENALRDTVREPYMLFPEFNNLYGKTKLENTLDHWTPQNPHGVEYEEEFKERYLNNLGNMVLSTRGRNASDSNSLPTDRSTMSTLLSRQKLEEYKGVWDKEQIKSRQKEISSFAKNYWNPENVG
jgi:uncharacterized protein with ParB-like and HNH nuclease domain